MKQMKLAVLAIALVGIFGAGNVLAADTATITVTADVQSSCVFDTTAATLAFGTIDPVANVFKETNIATINYTCVAGSTFTVVDVENGTYELINLDDGVTTIGYDLLYDSDPLSGGESDGAQGNFTIKAELAAGSYGGATVGNYEDIVTLSFNY